jgi:hypothetical protein
MPLMMKDMLIVRRRLINMEELRASEGECAKRPTVSRRDTMQIIVPACVIGINCSYTTCGACAVKATGSRGLGS